jgi:hypothetical protein
MCNIYFKPNGRLGNALMRYIAMLCFQHKYPTTNIHLHDAFTGREINEIQYIQLMTVPGNVYSGPDLLFSKFYQIDEIYMAYRDKIKAQIRNSIAILKSSPHDGDHTYHIDRLYITPNRYYDFVIHLRLEDFVTYGLHMDSQRIIQLLELLKPDNLFGEIAIVVNKPKTDFEHEYIQTITDWFKENNIPVQIESNDIYTDYAIISNASTVVCSMSTLSWCSVFLSDKITKCYFPRYVTKIETHRGYIQSFRKPIENTDYY